MKKALMLALAGFFVAGTCMAAISPAKLIQAKGMMKSYSDVKKVIMVNETSPQFTIKLRANPTTGYLWLLKNYNAQLLTLVNHHYVAPANKKMMGAPGFESWTFKATAGAMIAPRLAYIDLVYARPFELGGAKNKLSSTRFTVVTH